MKDQHVTLVSKSSVLLFPLSRSWVFGLSPLFVLGLTRRRLTYSLLNTCINMMYITFWRVRMFLFLNISTLFKRRSTMLVIFIPPGVFFFDFLVLLKFLAYVLTYMQSMLYGFNQPPSSVDLSLFLALGMLETRLIVKVLNEQGLLYPRLYFQFASHARLRCLL